MSPFKRMIVGLSALLLWIAMAAGALCGAILGHAVAQFLGTSPYLGPRTGAFSVAGLSDIELAGLVIGALMGLLIPAFAASLLFLLTEIQRKTQDAAEHLAALKRASTAKRIEPSAPPAANPRPVGNGHAAPTRRQPIPLRAALKVRPRTADVDVSSAEPQDDAVPEQSRPLPS